MNIYPAIDLKSGQCVRLYQGQYDQITLYNDDPINLAKSFAEQGATWLHVVDLDGAKNGESIHLDLILKIKKESGLHIQTGGGIRTKLEINKMLQNGIDRIILGSIAVTKPDEVKSWLNVFGEEQIALALDVKIDKAMNPILAIHGWQTTSHLTLWKLLDDYQDSLLKHVLCTDIARDGTLMGCNIDLYKECLKKYPSLCFQASGGIHNLSDLRALSSIAISSVVIGKALYENKFSLRNALDEVAIC